MSYMTQFSKVSFLLLPMMKFVIFLERAPTSDPLSMSNIGIQVEPLTHACR